MRMLDFGSCPVYVWPEKKNRTNPTHANVTNQAFACPAMHVRLKHACLSMVFVQRVQFKVIWFGLQEHSCNMLWLWQFCLEKKKTISFVSVHDGRTCIILESQHICVFCCVSMLIYVNVFVSQFSMQPPVCMLVVSHMFWTMFARCKPK